MDIHRNWLLGLLILAGAMVIGLYVVDPTGGDSIVDTQKCVRHGGPGCEDTFKEVFGFTF